jgi:gluconokinase
MVIVVMGVSGSGKSHLGKALAAAEGWDFQEGDELHPAANIAKMRAGVPLDDDDRGPWLDRIAAWIADHLRADRPGVVACSALKRRYRDRLRRAGGGVRFVYLRVPHDELLRRMRQRHHFMPPSLLESQLQTLEEPAMETDALTVSGEGDIAATLAAARAAIRRWQGN